MPKPHVQELCDSQTKGLKIDQILLGCTIPKHALHVVLQLILAVKPIEPRYHNVSSGEIVENAIEGEHVGI